ncbi:MAG: hypothetical protein V4702_04055 [Patescibacteria group bacterium]
MTRQIEASPHLVSPDYWGVDISDVDAFQGAPERTWLQNTPSLNRQALSSLCEVIMAAQFNCTVDTQAASGDERFDPTVSELPDGSVVILQREYVTKNSTPEGQPGELVNLDGNPIAKPDQETPPISKPYSEFWKIMRNTGEEWWCESEYEADSHQEFALYPDQGMSYGRYLEWGVLTTTADGERLLKKVCFDDQGPLLPNLWVWAHTRPRIGERLPIQLGTATRQHYISKGDRTTLELSRHAYAVTSRAGYVAYPVGDKDASGGSYRDHLEDKNRAGSYLTHLPEQERPVLRALTRLVDISSVDIAASSGGHKEKAMTLRERVRRLSTALGGITLPGAQPSPA